MVVQRRQPARSRLGNLARLQDRRGAERQSRIAPFLESIFHKLLLNFTWWVNQKDAEGKNVFQGGFLGLDNISVFDRSSALPFGGQLDQCDGTAWMGFYSLVMLKIALELAKDNPVYQDLATKFYEHFLAIAGAISGADGSGHSLWDKEDGFFYDQLRLKDGEVHPLKVRSLVGVMSLLAVETLEPDLLEQMPDFTRRMKWFIHNRPHLTGNMASVDVPGVGERRLISILTRERLESVMRYLLDEDEFLSDYGIRSVSKYHEDHPYTFSADGMSFTLSYQPAESHTGLFGGNSNWRGPIWFPINYLVIESLQKFDYYYGDSFKVEMPTGFGYLDDARRGGERTLAAPDPAVPARWRSAPDLWRTRRVSGRSAVARPDPVQRVFSRRQRCGTGRKSPDGLDGSGRQADPAIRRVNVGRTNRISLCRGTVQSSIALLRPCFSTPCLQNQIDQKEAAMQGLSGKNVLVTGGSSGIGQAIAIRLGAEGANVAINYRKGLEEAKETEAVHPRGNRKCRQ